ncbi:leucine-rich repeat-containing protein 49-like isoform X2 [Ptychodera flava]|uniref:leucine-rich repeat-containing protein 49-like isoform X2 n=1 Tax=Ptychodera flava TaxID=63121 RepID=UPI00396A0E73
MRSNIFDSTRPPMMYHQNRSRSRATLVTKDINPFGVQLSLQASATTVNERPMKQNPDFRLTRDQSAAFRPNEVPGRRSGEHTPERHSASPHFNIPDQIQRSGPGNGSRRQIHYPSTAYATQLTDLTHPDSQDVHSDSDENSALTQHTRHIQSAGGSNVRQHKSSTHLPGDRVIFAESPSVPGIPIVYRTPEERGANPDRLNLDRRRLTVCPILEGEEHLRLLNFQHNMITKIQHLNNLRRLIFLDLYDNQIEEISGLTSLKSLRVLMLGKNRIKTIENLETLIKLDVLDLHGNQISRIESLCHLGELRVLNLAGNMISHVDNLSGMDSLAELNLRRNRIVSVVDVDNLPNLQRLFLSFNQISSFDDIQCLSDTVSLSELSLDGNPLSQEQYYKQTVLRFMNQLRQLDMKRITEEERRIANVMARKEDERKKESNKIALMKEKRRIAISNAARQWEVTQGTAMAKTIRLQPGPLTSHTNLTTYASNNSMASVDVEESRPDTGSSQRGSRSNSVVDLIDPRDKSQTSSQTVIYSDPKSKSMKPDLLANMPDDVCHLAELEGDTLHLYGPGSLEALDKNWGIQAASAVSAVSFKFINFNEIAKHLHKIRSRFPNVSTILFGAANISCFQHINALSVLRRLDNLTISSEGNPITMFTLWKPYTLFRLAHFSLRKINDVDVTAADIVQAEKLFGSLSHITTSQLPQSRLLTLLGESKRKQYQVLSDQELRARKQLASDLKTSSESVGRAGLQYSCEEALADIEQERRQRHLFAKSYIKELTSEAILVDHKLSALQQIWPRLFIEMIQNAVLEMSNNDKYLRKCLQELESNSKATKEN